MEIIVKDYLSTYLGGANYQTKQLFEEKINLSDDEEIIFDFEGVKAREGLLLNNICLKN